MLQGLFPPLPTPFAAGAFAPDRLSANIARLCERPLDGFVVLGSNGEAPLLEDDERASIIRTARAALSGGRVLIAGAGRESTAATIRSVSEAFALGADAALVGVPCYYRPQMTREVLREHYLRVADASDGPILLYSVPVFTGLPVEPALFGELLRHERIIGIKDSAGDTDNLVALVEAARRAGRPDACILAGSARSLVGGAAVGIAGAILAVASLVPELCAEAFTRARRGEAAAASAAADRITPLADAVTRAHGVAGLKAAFDLLGWFGGDPRPPLLPAGPAAREEIAALLASAGARGVAR